MSTTVGELATKIREIVEIVRAIEDEKPVNMDDVAFLLTEYHGHLARIKVDV